MAADTPNPPDPTKPRQRTANRLTDNAIKGAIKDIRGSADGKAKRLQDGGQLSLLLKPEGAAYWHARVRFGGKDTLIQLGSYPKMTLAQARVKRDEVLAPARAEPDRRQDPATVHRLAKLRQKLPTDDSFAAVAREWLALKVPGWSESHTKRERGNLEKDLIPALGHRRIGDIKPPEVLAVARKVQDERSAPEMARRVLGTADKVFQYAVITGRADTNPASRLTAGLADRVPGHYAAITDPQTLAGLLRAIHAYTGGPVVKAALMLAPIVFQRPGQLRIARWQEFDLDAALWTAPARNMKGSLRQKEHGPSHIIPLPRQAVAILRDLHRLTGTSPESYVFPGRHASRPMSDNGMRTALYSMGYTGEVHTIHGFRATARTLIDEDLELDDKLVDAQQAHAVKDANGRAYNRTTHLRQRAAMLQEWADWLDALRLGNHVKVTPFRAKNTG